MSLRTPTEIFRTCFSSMESETHFLFKPTIKMTISTTTKNTFSSTATIWQNINIQWISTWSCWQRKISYMKWNLCSFFFLPDKWRTHVSGTTGNENASARLPLLRTTTNNIKHDTLTVHENVLQHGEHAFRVLRQVTSFVEKKEMIS